MSSVSKSSDSKSSSSSRSRSESKPKSESKPESKSESKPKSESKSPTGSSGVSSFESASKSTPTSQNASGKPWSGASRFDAAKAHAHTGPKINETSWNTPPVSTPPANTQLVSTSTINSTVVTAPAQPGAQVPPGEGGFLESVGNTIVNTGTALVDAGTTLVNQAAATIMDTVNPPVVDQAPLPPSFTGTVTVTGNTMTEDAEKIAAGALKIDPNEPATTYDGMYLGSDGFAYPPDKFKVTDVPPFRPANPVTNPPQTTYYVNGINTHEKKASDAAQDLANHTGTNVVLIYNATSDIPASNAIQTGLDSIQTGMDRIAVGNNKAVNTLADLITTDLNHGRKVNVIGYSQGGAILSHALEKVENRLKDAVGGFWGNVPGFDGAASETAMKLMSNINAVGIAGAGKNFPPGPQYTFFVNKQDPIPNALGVHPFNPSYDVPVFGGISLNPALAPLNGGVMRWNAPGAEVYLFNDPDSGGFSPHNLDVYLRHIQPITPGD